MAKVLTPARRARLEKLAAYLEGLPKRYRHFDMREYIGDAEADLIKKYALKKGGVAQCGTVACAVGHGPAAGILVPRSMVKIDWRDKPLVDWDRYSDLFVGNSLASEHSHAAFRWCFGAEWKEVDNHHWGAAARIRFLLANGAPPQDYDQNARRKWRKLYAPYRIDAKAPANA